MVLFFLMPDDVTLLPQAAQPFGVVGSNAVTSAGKWARRTRAGVIESESLSLS